MEVGAISGALQLCAWPCISLVFPPVDVRAGASPGPRADAPSYIRGPVHRLALLAAGERDPDHGAPKLLLPVLPAPGDAARPRLPASHLTHPGGLRELPDPRAQGGELPLAPLSLMSSCFQLPGLWPAVSDLENGVDTHWPDQFLGIPASHVARMETVKPCEQDQKDVRRFIPCRRTRVVRKAYRISRPYS